MIEITPRTMTMMSKTVLETISEILSVPIHDVPRVFYHGIVLSVIISGFWLLDSLKDPILSNTIGIEYQPIAKVLSVITTLMVVCIYDYFTSVITKPILFHLVSWFYGVVFLAISAILSSPIYGLTSTSNNPRKLIGWIAYFSIESYGSLMVTLFWSFTNSVINLEEAKGTYGLILAIAQIGAIIGSTVATSANLFGVSQLFIIGSMTVLSVSLLMKAYTIIYRKVPAVIQVSSRIEYHPSDQELNKIENESESKTHKDDNNNNHKIIKHNTSSIFHYFRNFYAGFLLITKYNYTLKIMAVACLYEIIITVMDYEFKIMGAFHSSSSNSSLSSSSLSSSDNSNNNNDNNNNHQFDSLFVNRRQYANLLGHFGQFTNIISLVISIFGFSYIVHRIGIKYALLIFPTCLFFVVIVTNLYPTLPVLFISVSLMKALIFSLHDPVKELLYNPTSDAIKFKAKAWIDVFGSRSAKAIGSLMTNVGGSNIHKLRNISEIPCLILSISILYIAWSAGDDFLELVKNGKVIGENSNNNSNNNLQKTKYWNEDFTKLPIRNGIKPGDVGYDGYDLHLFDGVFVENESDDKADHQSK